MNISGGKVVSAGNKGRKGGDPILRDGKNPHKKAFIFGGGGERTFALRLGERSCRERSNGGGRRRPCTRKGGGAERRRLLGRGRQVLTGEGGAAVWVFSGTGKGFGRSKEGWYGRLRLGERNERGRGGGDGEGAGVGHSTLRRYWKEEGGGGGVQRLLPTSITKV